HGDLLAKVFNAEWGEGEHLDFFGAIDPDHAVFGLHADGEIMKTIDGFAEFCGDAVDGLDGMDLVQLHGQAASAMCRTFHFQGRSSGRRDRGMSGNRPSTSASQACGSTSFILAVTIREYMKAARSPPRGDPAKSHAFLPRAIPRRARSAALFVRQMRPSSRKRVKASQRPSSWSM